MNTGNKTRLDSWKDIAQYLDRDLSTVRRWEKEKGLPVHRIPGGLRHAVFAYREEIDEWLTGAGRAVSEAEVEPASRSRWRLVTALALLVIAILAVTATVKSRRRLVEPVRARLVGDTVVAETADGELVWRFTFPGALKKQIPGDVRVLIHVADIDGDGHREVLVAPPFEEEPRAALYCLNSDGQLRWRYQPEATWRFGPREYTGPWQLTAFTFVDRGERKEIWMAIAHHTWWPAFIVRLDDRGQSRVAMVSSGWISEMEAFPSRAGTVVLAGGMNNEYNAAAFAILRPDDPPASSPQTPGSEFACEECPTARPFRYFVFEQSELSQLTRSNYNTVRHIRKLGDSIEIRTSEVGAGAGEGQGIFELSGNFDVRAASMTDLYWAEHRRLEAAGQLKHTPENCPERLKGRRVQVWEPERREVYVKPAGKPDSPK